MANTYTLLANATVGSGGSSGIDFTSIPQTYTDLVIRASIRDNADSNAGALAMKFNSSTTSYSGKIIYANGSGSAFSANLSGLGYAWAGTINPANSTANTFSNHEIYIPSYTSGNFKPYSVFSVVENNATTAEYLVATAGLWQGTGAISSINLTINSNPKFAQYSTFYLYGISNA